LVAFKDSGDFASFAVDFSNFKLDVAFGRGSAFGVGAITLTNYCFCLKCVGINVATSNTATFGVEEDVTSNEFGFLTLIER
jgi:hypothetical protein